jgi:geranylgeranyl pyrophosphate synthase
VNPQILEYQTRTQATLDSALSDPQVPERLLEAMRYSTLSSGKRVRALLVYAAGHAVDAPVQRLDAVAAAMECIHAYSLIHDDLPAMDDDDLRRGLPTNHIKFDDATAILAGDALQSIAFSIINSPKSGLSNRQCRLISQSLAQAAGPAGMVGGQMLDILATQQTLDQLQLEEVHRGKTGALISAAVECGALCSNNPSTEQLKALNNFASRIGLAFQVVDDILDIESSTEQLGKTSGADLALGKSTYPALLGLNESKKLAEKLYHEGVASLDAIGDNSLLLRDLADLIVRRKH